MPKAEEKGTELQGCIFYIVSTGGLTLTSCFLLHLNSPTCMDYNIPWLYISIDITSSVYICIYIICIYIYMFVHFQNNQYIFIEGLPPMPPTPNRGDSKVGCGRSKQWFGDGWQVSGILQPFCVDAHRSQKTAETLLLEPTKNKEKKSPQAKQTFAQRKTWKPASHQAKLKKKVFGTRMRKGRTPAGFVPKPLRNRSRKNAETSLLEPIKKRKK